MSNPRLFASDERSGIDDSIKELLSADIDPQRRELLLKKISETKHERQMALAKIQQDFIETNNSIERVRPIYEAYLLSNIVKLSANQVSNTGNDAEAIATLKIVMELYSARITRIRDVLIELDSIPVKQVEVYQAKLN